MIGVSPCRTSTSSIGTPRWSATICENVVTWPCPCGDVPVTTCTLPVGRHADRRGVPAAGPVAERRRGSATARARTSRRRSRSRCRAASCRPARAALPARRAGRRSRRARAPCRARRGSRRSRSSRPDAIAAGNSRDEVAPPDLDRVVAELARQRVHRPLDRVRRLRPAGAAVGVGRRRVREDAGALERVAPARRSSRVEEGAEQRDARRDELQVRAHGGHQVHADGGDLAVGVGGELDLLDLTSRPWIVAR